MIYIKSLINHCQLPRHSSHPRLLKVKLETYLGHPHIADAAPLQGTSNDQKRKISQ